MIFSVNGTILQAGQPQRHRYETQRHDSAERRERSMARVGIVRATGQRIDQMAGKNRHEQVGRGRAQQAAGDDRGAHRLIEPVPEHERNHHADRGGTVFRLNGHGVIRLRSRANRLHLN